MKDIFKVVKSLEDSGLLLEGVTERIKNEAKEQKKRISYYAIRHIRGSLLGNISAGKGVKRAGEGTARVGYASRKSLLKNFF